MYSVKRWDKNGETVEVERLTLAEKRDMVSIELEYNAKITVAGYFEFKETGKISPEQIKKRTLTKVERANFKRFLGIGTAQAKANANGLELDVLNDIKGDSNAPRIPEELINFRPNINLRVNRGSFKPKKRK